MSLSESFHRDNLSSSFQSLEPSGKLYDRVVIADNFEPRMLELREYLLNEKLVDGNNIDLFLVDRKNPEFYREVFRDRVGEVLAGGGNLLVGMNYFVSLRNKYLEDLIDQEEKTDRQFGECLIISCVARHLIEDALGSKCKRGKYVASSRGEGKIDLGRLGDVLGSNRLGEDVGKVGLRAFS